ncbi:neuronal acetylcholine receptor subunit alpha-7 [Oncorhynchus kisutch]|uniref:neuronal acetylcholine receptor subunit alpha-7 n=1 Tax=Oncorhynchus kisutch TaxID=8019 RepID=UPI0012DECFF0|nr:neuronal acetylcholine receptor subunit alpha-7-like [Oncorhynchus kisutch]
MRHRKCFGYVCAAVYLWTAFCFKGCVGGQYQRKLYKDLLINYNRLERPVFNDSAPILVELGFTLLQIIDVDEKNQVLMTNAWLQLHWTDTYLSWNPENFPGVQNLRFPSNQIWVPDILLYNRYVPVLHHYQPPSRYIPVLHHYPPSPPGAAVLLTACKEPYPDVTFTVTMRRRTLYYGLNLLIPCVLISGLALLVFLLPADSGEKISLGITVLLSLTVFMLLVAEIMPATSDSVPLIGQYFSFAMMIVGLSLVVTVLVLQFHHHDPHGVKMPKWMRVILLNWCAWFLRMKKPGEERKTTTPSTVTTNTNTTPSSATGGYKYSHPPPHHASTSSIQMGSIPGGQPSNTSTTNGNMNLYFGYHSVGMGGMGSLGGSHDNPCCPPSSDSSGVGVCSGGAGGGSQTTGTGGTCSPNEALFSDRDAGILRRLTVDQIPEIGRILEEVHFIAQRFREQDEGEAVCSEWKFAAAVVDRLCLVAFTIFSIIGTFTILMSAPNFLEAVTKDYLT